MIRMLHIKEKFVSSGKFNSYNGPVYFEVFKNPGLSEIKKLFNYDFSGNNFEDLRGILTLTGDLYIVTCEEAELIHDEIVQILDETNFIGYNPFWNETNEPKLLALFIRDRSNLRFVVSIETHTETVENLDDFKNVSKYPIEEPSY